VAAFKSVCIKRSLELIEKRADAQALQEAQLQPKRLGQVGGEKYLDERNGIFFSFFVDHNQLLGGDEYSLKIAGHQMKGLSYCAKLRQVGITSPLTVLVDQRGKKEKNKIVLF
jgi:hypothetical protein